MVATDESALEYAQFENGVPFMLAKVPSMFLRKSMSAREILVAKLGSRDCSQPPPHEGSCRNICCCRFFVGVPQQAEPICPSFLGQWATAFLPSFGRLRASSVIPMPRQQYKRKWTVFLPSSERDNSIKSSSTNHASIPLLCRNWIDL